MGDEKKNQHFVPRSFLKGFATDSEDSLIWGYDKQYSKCTGKRSISQICSLEYYYEQPMADGTKTQILEDAFQAVERPAIEIIRNLSTFHKLSSEDKGRLSFYIGLLLTRGPSFRDGIHELHKHHAELMLQWVYESGRLPEPHPIPKKLIVNNDITSVIENEILPHVSLHYMAQAASVISQSLCNKKWDIYYISNTERFATSDTPVMFEDFYLKKNRAIGPAHPQSLVFCPITKKTLIAARPFCPSDSCAIEFLPVKVGMVDKTNEHMCLNAQRFVYASEQSQALLGYIKKSKGYCKKYKTYRIGNAIMSQWDILLPYAERTISDQEYAPIHRAPRI